LDVVFAAAEADAEEDELEEPPQAASRTVAMHAASSAHRAERLPLTGWLE
jgi:hypothetical protein